MSILRRALARWLAPFIVAGLIDAEERAVKSLSPRAVGALRRSIEKHHGPEVEQERSDEHADQVEADLAWRAFTWRAFSAGRPDVEVDHAEYRKALCN